MQVIISDDVNQIQQWIAILSTTYCAHPSTGLAQTIYYYVQKLVHHEDVVYDSIRLCDYYSMLKYWHWRAKFNDTAVY